MRRRKFIALLLATLPSLGCAEHAAADKLRLVGVLDAQREGDEAVDHEAFRQQLDKLGWTAGKNINIEYRWGAGSIDRVQAFAKELARLNPDVLFGITTPAAAALQAETHTVPIVFAQVSDPVGSGFVNSFQFATEGVSEWQKAISNICAGQRLLSSEYVSGLGASGKVRRICCNCPSRVRLILYGGG
jgi:ABC-type uncharacterized transport system substrate-binding protein